MWRTRAPTRSACSGTRAADAPAYRLTAAHVDALIDQSVAAAPDKLGRADVDQRCRSYMREFSEGESSTRWEMCQKDGAAGDRLGVGVLAGNLLKHAKGEASCRGQGGPMVVAARQGSRAADAAGPSGQAGNWGRGPRTLLPPRLHTWSLLPSRSRRGGVARRRAKWAQYSATGRRPGDLVLVRRDLHRRRRLEAPRVVEVGAHDEDVLEAFVLNQMSTAFVGKHLLDNAINAWPPGFSTLLISLRAPGLVK